MGVDDNLLSFLSNVGWAEPGSAGFEGGNHGRQR